MVAKSAATAALLMLLAAPGGAQWIHYPTPDIPRTKDGKPDLTARAPRAADGKPDLSGMWAMGGLGPATNLGDLEMAPAAQALFKQRLQTYGHDDPATACLPEGPRSALAGLDPLRIVQTKNITFVLYETGQFRQIFTDGRPLPKELSPTWMGYSIGRWEGDTFVVETTGYNDRSWLDFVGHPHSEALRLTERYRRTDFGHMALEMTLDDPKTYTKPISIKLSVSFVPDDDLIENVCLENEKDHGRLVGRIADEKKTEKKVAAGVLAQYAGAYDVGPLGVWNVSIAGDGLAIQLPAGGKQPLFAISDTKFVFQSSGGTVTFVKDARKNVVTHLLLTIVEGDFRGERK